MSKTFEEISKEAIHLSKNQRLALARFLLDLEDTPENPKVEQVWESEILKRAQAVEEASVKGVKYGDVLGKVDSALSR